MNLMIQVEISKIFCMKIIKFRMFLHRFFAKKKVRSESVKAHFSVVIINQPIIGYNEPKNYADSSINNVRNSCKTTNLMGNL